MGVCFFLFSMNQEQYITTLFFFYFGRNKTCRLRANLPTRTYPSIFRAYGLLCLPSFLKILYATTGSLPSYIPLNRIWNFICNGTFTGNSVSLLFDATTLIQECPQYTVSFEGNINGQLTIKKQNYPVQKYVTKTLVYHSQGKVSGVQFVIEKPECLRKDKTYEFYLNLYLNDQVLG